jgi:hypothetical protein
VTTTRPEAVISFIDAARILFQSSRLPDGGRAVASRVFERLQTVSNDGKRHGERYPVCEWIAPALAKLVHEPTPMGDAARAIIVLEPQLGQARRTSGTNGSAHYIDNHVNATICGPGGTESRYDVQLGFTIMAPETRYPDHGHPPEEAYVLFTPGEFRQNDGDWFDPGIGGGIHNVPNAIHAVRSHAEPFLAIWCLLIEK